MSQNVERTFPDAGVFIGALRRTDPRFSEAYPLVEKAHRGDFSACTSVGVLSEVYAALTWVGAQPPLSPADAARAVVRLIEPPSAIDVLTDGLDVGLRHMQLADRLAASAT